jgi:hypothetical protein
MTLFNLQLNQYARIARSGKKRWIKAYSRKISLILWMLHLV